MNGAATVTATEDHQHQQTQNETTSEHPRSPASPLSARHGEITQKVYLNVEDIIRLYTYEHLINFQSFHIMQKNQIDSRFIMF